MTKNEILSNLCIHDKRNIHYIPLEDYEDEVKPRNNCYCDNCFYGRDDLAMYILELLK